MSAEKFGVPSDSGRVEDIDKAWAGALAEKPVRDLAREGEVSEEEKAILDRLAMRRGEKALQEYDTEKEKNPAEKLRARIDAIVLKMKEKGLEKDADIVGKIKERLNRYINALLSSKDKMEDEKNKKITAADLVSDREIRNGILVTHRVGKEGGGWAYQENGFRVPQSLFIDKEGAEDIRTKIEKVKREHGRDLEMINFSFSKKGATEFFRDIGVLGPTEESVELPKIYEKAKNEEGKRLGDNPIEINPLSYTARFPTNIEGVTIYIDRDPSGRSGKEEEQVALEFDNEFLEALIKGQEKES